MAKSIRLKKIFITYSKKDRKLLDELMAHLSVLEKSGKADVWFDGEIEAGADWEQAKKEALDAADVVLLIVSADFIGSDFYDSNIQQTVLNDKKKQVVPIIMRECAWSLTPIANLKVLPSNGKPIADDDLQVSDSAMREVVEKIYKIIHPGETITTTISTKNSETKTKHVEKKITTSRTGTGDGGGGGWMKKIGLATIGVLMLGLLFWGVPELMNSSGKKMNRQQQLVELKKELLKKYDHVGDFKLGYFDVRKDAKWGFVDSIGSQKIPLKYEEVRSFQNIVANVKEGNRTLGAGIYLLARAKLNNKWGWIDSNNGIIIPFEFHTAKPFLKGEARVSRDGENFYSIDEKGHCVKDCPDIKKRPGIPGGILKDITIGTSKDAITDAGKTILKEQNQIKIDPEVLKSLLPKQMTDSRDNQIYKTVFLGGNTWMAENLNYKTPQGGSFCYNNDPANCQKFGRLYTNQAAKKACPLGWHLPKDGEWKTLVSSQGENFSGNNHGKVGYSTLMVGGKSGFKATLGGKHRATNPTGFSGLNTIGHYWTSSNSSGDYFYVYRFLKNEKKLVRDKGEYFAYQQAFSCRCVKDAE